MSVLARKRIPCKIEYERKFHSMNNYLNEKLDKIPKRYNDVLSKPFQNCLNQIYEKIMNLSDLRLKEGLNKTTYKLCLELLELFHELISFSYTYWNISSGQTEIKSVSSKQRRYWSQVINKNIITIVNTMDKHKEYCKNNNDNINIPSMIPISYNDFKYSEFSQKICYFEKYLFRKAVVVERKKRYAQIDMFLNILRKTIYYTVRYKNVIIDKDKINRNMFSKNKNLLNEYRITLTSIYKTIRELNRPIRELAYKQMFSEDELKEICNLYFDCYLILDGVKKRLQYIFKTKF